MGGKAHFVEQDAGLTVPAVELAEVEGDVEAEEAFDARDTTETLEKLHNGHDLVRSQDEQESDSDCWEVESIFADALEGMGDQQLYEGDVDACSLDEALTYRKLLRSLGADAFILSTLDNDSITAKKLCTAFGIRPPAFLEGAPDAAYIPLLSLGISRELSKRVKLPQYNTIEDVIELLQKSTNIILLTGAGISTSLGIPDFRSKDTGLYSKLAHLGLTDPQEVFDIEIFKEDPGIFYSIAKDILPTTSRYSPTHAFIKLLQDKEKLLTNFSQNIDNLEAKAGVRREKLIQCHGSFATATCVKCGHHVDGEEIYDDLKAGKVAVCPKCTKIINEQGVKRKRPTNDRSEKSHKDRRRRFASDFNSSDDDDANESDNIPQPGVMKPDITFFGENLPDEFHDRLRNHDRALVDLVIVIGTSLKVAPVSEVVGYLPANVPQLYISRTPVSHVDFDVDLLGDCDVIVAELCRRAGWDLVHEMVPPDRSVRVELQEGFPSRYVFTEEGNPVA